MSEEIFLLVAGGSELPLAPDRQPTGTDVLLPGGQATTPSFPGNTSVLGDETCHRGAIGRTGL